MKQRTKMILIAATGSLLSLAFFVCSQYGREPLTELIRPGVGKGDQTEELEVEIADSTYTLEVTLKELPYTEEEAGALLAEAASGLEEIFLNGNADIAHIMTDVSMPSTWLDTGIEIGWYLSSWEYISPDGTVKNEGLENAETLEVRAELSLSDQEFAWNREIVVCPPSEPDEEEKLEMLVYQIESAQEDGGVETILLPDRLLGESVTWYPARDDRWLLIALLTVAALCAMTFGKRQEEEKALEKRERALQLAYPDIVSRLGLYMGAGLSMRNARERSVESYEQSGAGNDAYEEMRVTLREMRSGVAESAAYERFGMRCRLPSYLKLGTLLSQNLRKGTRNLSGLLQEESREAFENRKAYAKKLGEECESKLLLPMLLMLLTVLIMIMYPEVVSFQA
ncbi:MAG: hypothetical protein LUC60_07140 [Lachnospiraceae bacterium]|nr:hypothetical protein [Lachnospiraceae bacterium]